MLERWRGELGEDGPVDDGRQVQRRQRDDGALLDLKGALCLRGGSRQGVVLAVVGGVGGLPDAPPPVRVDSDDHQAGLAGHGVVHCVAAGRGHAGGGEDIKAGVGPVDDGQGERVGAGVGDQQAIARLDLGAGGQMLGVCGAEGGLADPKPDRSAPVGADFDA